MAITRFLKTNIHSLWALSSFNPFSCLTRATFRQVLRDGSFGELLVDGQRPSQWRHVFASVQSLAGLDPADLAPDTFDVVIVDEFHHAAAASYERWLRHLAPVLLLGLTATPERTGG